MGMVGIFIPIYLYTLGYSIPQIAMLEAILFLIKASMHPVSIMIHNSIGSFRLIGVANLSMIAYLFGLYQLDDTPALALPVFMLIGVSGSLYWIGFHNSLIEAIDKKTETKSLTNSELLRKVAVALGPLTGGVLATWHSFTVTILFAIGVMVVSTLLVITIPRKNKRRKLKFSELTLLHMRRDYLSNAAVCISSMFSLLIWPFIVFLLFENYAEVGVIFSLPLLFGGVLSHYLARKQDKNKAISRDVVAGTSYIISFVDICRIFARSVSMVGILNIIAESLAIIKTPAYVSHYYDRARILGYEKYILSMEVVGDLSKAGVWVLILCMSAIVGLGDDSSLYVVALLSAGTAPLVPLFFKNKA